MKGEPEALVKNSEEEINVVFTEELVRKDEVLVLWSRSNPRTESIIKFRITPGDKESQASCYVSIIRSIDQQEKKCANQGIKKASRTDQSKVYNISKC